MRETGRETGRAQRPLPPRPRAPRARPALSSHTGTGSISRPLSSIHGSLSRRSTQRNSLGSRRHRDMPSAPAPSHLRSRSPRAESGMTPERRAESYPRQRAAPLSRRPRASATRAEPGLTPERRAVRAESGMNTERRAARWARTGFGRTARTCATTALVRGAVLVTRHAARRLLHAARVAPSANGGSRYTWNGRFLLAARVTGPRWGVAVYTTTARQPCASRAARAGQPCASPRARAHRAAALC